MLISSSFPRAFTAIFMMGTIFFGSCFRGVTGVKYSLTPLDPEEMQGHVVNMVLHSADRGPELVHAWMAATVGGGKTRKSLSAEMIFDAIAVLKLVSDGEAFIYDGRPISMAFGSLKKLKATYALVDGRLCNRKSGRFVANGQEVFDGVAAALHHFGGSTTDLSAIIAYMEETLNLQFPRGWVQNLFFDPRPVSNKPTKKRKKTSSPTSPELERSTKRNAPSTPRNRLPFPFEAPANWNSAHRGFRSPDRFVRPRLPAESPAIRAINEEAARCDNNDKRMIESLNTFSSTFSSNLNTFSSTFSSMLREFHDKRDARAAAYTKTVVEQQEKWEKGAMRAEQEYDNDGEFDNDESSIHRRNLRTPFTAATVDTLGDDDDSESDDDMDYDDMQLGVASLPTRKKSRSSNNRARENSDAAYAAFLDRQFNPHPPAVPQPQPVLDDEEDSKPKAKPSAKLAPKPSTNLSSKPAAKLPSEPAAVPPAPQLGSTPPQPTLQPPRFTFGSPAPPAPPGTWGVAPPMYSFGGTPVPARAAPMHNVGGVFAPPAPALTPETAPATPGFNMGVPLAAAVAPSPAPRFQFGAGPPSPQEADTEEEEEVNTESIESFDGLVAGSLLLVLLGDGRWVKARFVERTTTGIRVQFVENFGQGARSGHFRYPNKVRRVLTRR